MPCRQSRFTFLAKILAALGLIVGADWLVTDGHIGSWLGGLAIAWALILAIVRPALRRGPALIAWASAIVFALVMVNQPGLLAWVLFWVALSIATLLPRTAGFDDAWRWAIRLAAHAATGPFSPLFDLPRLFRPRPHRGRLTARSLAAMLALPIAMSALFVALFASANPLIARAFADIRLPSIGEVAFWLFALAIVWPSLRPRSWATRIATMMPEAEVSLPGASLTSVLISLALFNTVFAIQNGLDLAFLWSGAALPAGVSLANYAHKGAYPLIVTALLAGVFVLATMKPGTATAASPAIRRLVVLWVAQNLLLVASSILRTCDYIAVYMLTAWRIAALAWMLLVALGLVLICWRMLTGRSARWLINWNALAAALVLTASSIVDLDAVAAEWNVNHAKEVGGNGVPLDLCGLNFLRGSALLPLIELEQRPLDPGFRDRVRSVRLQIMGGNLDWQTSLVSQQANWRTWTGRNSIRLEAARRLLGPHPVQPSPIPQGATRDCDGSIDLPTPPSPPIPPLTKAPAP
ncbi:MAG: hypothetical protein JWO15_3636 [Sphingomonadales bacterium]|nr:hypothetical protein [Sphingomonadales bacterium]